MCLLFSKSLRIVKLNRSWCLTWSPLAVYLNGHECLVLCLSQILLATALNQYVQSVGAVLHYRLVAQNVYRRQNQMILWAGKGIRYSGPNEWEDYAYSSYWRALCSTTKGSSSTQSAKSTNTLRIFSLWYWFLWHAMSMGTVKRTCLTIARTLYMVQKGAPSAVSICQV